MCVAAIGVVAGLAGSVMQGMAAQAQAKAQEQIADYNAQVAAQNAIAANMQGYAQGAATASQFDEVAGEQRAAIAKSGVDTSSVSAGVLALETEKRKRMAMETDIWRGRTEAWKYKTQQGQFEAEADAAKAAGKSAMFTSILGGLGNAIGGLSGGLGVGTSLSLGSSTTTPGLGPMAPAMVPIPRPKPTSFQLDPYGRIIGGI